MEEKKKIFWVKDRATYRHYVFKGKSLLAIIYLKKKDNQKKKQYKLNFSGRGENKTIMVPTMTPGNISEELVKQTLFKKNKYTNIHKWYIF